MVSNGNGQDLHHKRQKFLAHYADLCVIGKAADATGIVRQTVYDWIEKSAEFKQAFESAKQGIVEKLEREAIRRAYAGVEKDVWHKGRAVGVERTYSDVLLIFLLKGAAPDKYRERHELSNPPGEAFKVTIKQVVDD